MKKNLIVILGPTASGKTKMAVKLAYEINGEIISADSRQVYRGMDIGTGKDLRDYIFDGKSIPYHLVDILDPVEEFNLYEFQKGFYPIFKSLENRGVMPIMVGGTGLYLESILLNYEMPFAPQNQNLRKELASKTLNYLREILYGFKEDLHNKTDLDDRERVIRAIEIEKARIESNKKCNKKPRIDPLIFGIQWDRQEIRRRITFRLHDRLKQGMIEEVKALHEKGLSWERLYSFGLEYRWISQHLQGKVSLNEMIEKLNTAIHQFAKRQETWFRRMEKRGLQILWIQENNDELIKENIQKYFHE